MAKVEGWTKESLKTALRFGRITRSEYDRIALRIDSLERKEESLAKDRIWVVANSLRTRDSVGANGQWVVARSRTSR